jgi:predicted P-loop ATPase
LVQDIEQRSAKFTPGTVTPADKLMPLSPSERFDLNRIKLDERKKVAPAVEAALNERTVALVQEGVPFDIAQRRVLANFRGELCPGDILYFDNRNIGAVSVESVISNPSAYDGETLADPADGSSGKPNKAKFYANKMMINCFAHGGSTYRMPLDASSLFGDSPIDMRTIIGDVIQDDVPDVEQSSNIHNVRVLLRSLPDFRDLFRYNSFLDQIEVLRKVPDVDHRHDASDDGKYPRPLMDVDAIRITARLQASEMKKAKLTDVEHAIKLIAASNQYNPLKLYLKECLNKWDGVPRLDTMLIDYAGADDSEYVRGVSRMFMISLAARGLNPGTKVDTMLITEGDQGASKSTFGMTLMRDPEWFSDSLPHDLSSRDAMQHLRGKWFIEVAEMSALNRNDSNEMKQFLTRQVDRYRDPYAKYEKSHPRTACFYGTTNLSRYLKDETGNRRYWPVRCRGNVDKEGLAAVRDHLFGEAVYLHLAGVPHWPTRDWEARHCEPEQSSRTIGDVWEDAIEEFLIAWTSTGNMEMGFDVAASLPKDWDKRRAKGVVSVQDVAVGALKIFDTKTLDHRTHNRITSVMMRSKWEHCGDNAKVTGRRVWRKKP